MSSLQNTIACAMAVSTLALSARAWGGGNICPPSNAVGIDGIGDGCSTSIAGYVLPDIAAFRSTFTPACNAHDKCYTTLGTSYGECDGRFLSDMQSACRSSFNPFFLPVEYAACNATAYNYYAGVQAWGSVVNPLPGMQADALRRSRQMQASVNADTCGTTPEGTTLYAGGLMSQINSTFLAYASRLPTVYEFFDAVNAGDLLADRSGWNSLLVTKAIAAASVVPPSVATSGSSGLSSVVLSIAAPASGTTYFWKANNATSGTSSISFKLKNPKYDLYWAIEGFVKATGPGGQRNLGVLNVPVYEQGWCATAPGPNVHCY